MDKLSRDRDDLSIILIKMLFEEPFYLSHRFFTPGSIVISSSIRWRELASIRWREFASVRWSHNRIWCFSFLLAGEARKDYRLPFIRHFFPRNANPYFKVWSSAIP